MYVLTNKTVKRKINQNQVSQNESRNSNYDPDWIRKAISYNTESSETFRRGMIHQGLLYLCMVLLHHPFLFFETYLGFVVNNSERFLI